MIALSVSGVGLSYGTDVILKDVTFSVNDGDKLGVIGVNGAGKTSLFRIITGKERADSGDVFIQKGHTVGILEQNPDLSLLPGEMTCTEYMYTAHPELRALEGEIEKTERELRGAGSDAEINRLAARLEEQNRVFFERGGLEFRARCRSMLLRLGFSEEGTEQKIRTLSGGQYTRLSLARLLATEPDILMLDEPTNHLDVDALLWLEEFVASYKKTVIIISHDRYFLDSTTNKTLHVQAKSARLYHGNYSASKAQREAEAASLEKRYKEQQKVIERIKANIEFQRRCNREHNFVTIRSKEKQLARMEKIELMPKDPRSIRLRFSEEDASAEDVLWTKNLSFSFGATPLINNLNILVRRGERVLFLGRNGCGKSTLMKLFNSLLEPKSGKVGLGHNIKIGYYDQENRGLSDGKTVFGEMRDEYPEKTDFELRSTLALFLFDFEDCEKTVGTLSGGERARLTLAKLILKKVNLLIMDEPTNHLDISSCEALEDALTAFDGTIIAVSHDRYFIGKLATRIIELDGERVSGAIDYPLDDYDDAFSEYMRLRENIRSSISDASPKETVSSSKEAFEQKKRENAKKRADEKRIEKAHKRIEELEAETDALDTELFGSAATDYVRAAEIDKRKGEIEEELLSLYELVM